VKAAASRTSLASSSARSATSTGRRSSGGREAIEDCLEGSHLPPRGSTEAWEIVPHLSHSIPHRPLQNRRAYFRFEGARPVDWRPDPRQARDIVRERVRRGPPSSDEELALLARATFLGAAQTVRSRRSCCSQSTLPLEVPASPAVQPPAVQLPARQTSPVRALRAACAAVEPIDGDVDASVVAGELARGASALAGGALLAVLTSDSASPAVRVIALLVDARVVAVAQSRRATGSAGAEAARGHRAHARGAAGAAVLGIVCEVHARAAARGTLRRASWTSTAALQARL
jgi:hypothetical protein